MRSPTSLARPAALAALLLAAGAGPAQTTPPLRKYVGSPDYPALLKEPKVKAQLDALVGKAMPTLMHNLDVTAEMGLVGGAIQISGNATHGGGEEEGVVCVAEYDGKTEAAILSKGRITVFAKDKNYENLMVCIKDWITQANSGHRDRFTQPKNVAFAKST
ncbi:MAG TPA: hypothetical protein VML58_17450 [Burkholderiaceae bacterium]|nr:hypothetical protein [Burkholderiaceae bacterium]